MTEDTDALPTSEDGSDAAGIPLDAAADSPDGSTATDTDKQHQASLDEARRGLLLKLLAFIDRERPEGEQRKVLRSLDRFMPLTSPDQSIVGVTDRKELEARLDARLQVMEKHYHQIGFEKGFKEGFQKGYYDTVAKQESTNSGRSCKPKPRRSRLRRSGRRRRRR